MNDLVFSPKEIWKQEWELGSEESALGRLFRAGVTEEIARGDKGVSHEDTGVGNFQAEGILSAQVRFGQQYASEAWAECGSVRDKVIVKGLDLEVAITGLGILWQVHWDTQVEKSGGHLDMGIWNLGLG